MRSILKLGVLALLGLLVLIQFVPYGRDHTNPAPTKSVRFDSPTTAKLVTTACADCHSYETKWPWYTNVAPASWLVQKDVDDGRGVLNFSTWDKPQPDVGEVVDQVLSGEMPPAQYTVIHRSASLSTSERRKLADGLRRTYAADTPPPGGGGG